MMNALQLQLLDATLRRQPVLSLYLGLTGTTPSDHRQWPLELQNALKPVRERLQSAPHAEREQFDQCASHLKRALRSLAPGTGGQTWVAFATPAGVRHSELAPVPMATMIAWGSGIRMAPYVRLMNEDLPTVVVICDSAHADLWEYRGGASRLVERIHARHPSPHEPSHLSASPRPGFHSGTRGAVGRDEVQRQRREGTRRMLELTAKRSRQLAGTAGSICIGGIPHVATQLSQTILGPHARAEVIPGLDVHATEAQVTAAARAAVNGMRNRRDAAGLTETIERAAPAGFGALGPTEALGALEHGRVKELFISDRYMQEHMDDADWGVRNAHRNGVRVTVLTGDSATRLDEQGGLAAWLRYRLDGSAATRRPHEAAKR